MLAEAFARLAWILRLLVITRVFPLGWRRLDLLKLGVLDLSNAPSQRGAKHRPTPIDLTQAGVAAGFGDGGELFDALDVIELLYQHIGHKVIPGAACGVEKLVDVLDGPRFAPHVGLRELFRTFGLGAVADIVDAQFGGGEHLVDLGDDVRFVSDVLMRQFLHGGFSFAFRKVVLQSFLSGILQRRRRMDRNDCPRTPNVRNLPQCLSYARAHQARFQAAPPQDLPTPRLPTSLTNISSIMSVGLTAAQTRAQNAP